MANTCTLGFLAAFFLSAFTVPAIGAPVGFAGCRENPFSLADYDGLQRVTELALSGDGQTVVYAVGPFLATTDGEEKVFRQSLKGGSSATLLPISDARAITWLPDNRHIAFLSTRSGLSQVYQLDLASHELVQVTFAQDPVQAFEYSPDGATLAYRTLAQAPHHVSFYRRLKSGTSAIVVDKADDISMYDFVNPRWDASVRPGKSKGWIRTASGQTIALPLQGDVKQLNWSPDGKAISATFVAANSEPGVFHDRHTTLTVIRFPELTGVVTAGAVTDLHGLLTAYAGGEWYPDGHSILLRRVEYRDPWVSETEPEWTRLSIQHPDLAASRWHKITSYPGRARFFPQADGTFLRQDIVDAAATLFRDGVEGPPARALAIAGSSTQITFDRNGDTMAFVNEALDRPPEIYVRHGHTVEQLTHLNRNIAPKVCYQAREVHWPSQDGAMVQGWLLTPTSGKPPYPLITLVHGGPGFVVTDSFAPYFSLWPYPLEVWASHDVAVFIPNYRGTESFGPAFATPSALDAEPVDDVVTGVQRLIANGTADRARLGLLGHSHGAFLAPLVMERSKLFRAASFAEGAGNEVASFDLMSPSLDDLVLTPLQGNGVSMYDDVGPYVRLSPEFALGGLSTATLLEAGSNSLALQMLGFSKAVAHAGMPNEFAIYPDSGHNLRDPKLIRDAATRNMRWMDFWLDLSGENFQPPAAWRQQRDNWQPSSEPAANRSR